MIYHIVCYVVVEALAAGRVSTCALFMHHMESTYNFDLRLSKLQVDVQQLADDLYSRRTFGPLKKFDFIVRSMGA